jgi:hypothetical protein
MSESDAIRNSLNFARSREFRGLYFRIPGDSLLLVGAPDIGDRPVALGSQDVGPSPPSSSPVLSLGTWHFRKRRRPRSPTSCPKAEACDLDHPFLPQGPEKALGLVTTPHESGPATSSCLCDSARNGLCLAAMKEFPNRRISRALSTLISSWAGPEQGTAAEPPDLKPSAPEIRCQIKEFRHPASR